MLLEAVERVAAARHASETNDHRGNEASEGAIQKAFGQLGADYSTGRFIHRGSSIFNGQARGMSVYSGWPFCKQPLAAPSAHRLPNLGRNTEGHHDQLRNVRKNIEIRISGSYCRSSLEFFKQVASRIDYQAKASTHRTFLRLPGTLN